MKTKSIETRSEQLKFILRSFAFGDGYDINKTRMKPNSVFLFSFSFFADNDTSSHLNLRENLRRMIERWWKTVLPANLSRVDKDEIASPISTLDSNDDQHTFNSYTFIELQTWNK